MSDIVSKLKALGRENAINMSGKQTIAECLNAFGGEDKREIKKALKGAIKPVAIPLLKFNSYGGGEQDGANLRLYWVKNASYLEIRGSLNEGSHFYYSLNKATTTLKPGNYVFSSDIPVVGTNKGFIIRKTSNNSTIAYANASHTHNFSIASDTEVYLYFDIDGPFNSGNNAYNFKLLEQF